MGKLNDRLMGKTSNLGEKVAANPGKSISDQAPVTMPGQLGAFRLEAKRYQERIEELTNALSKQGNSNASLEIPLADLHEIPGRRRKLSPEDYAELKANLASNALIHAITVRRRNADGKPEWEVISGHNRLAIFRELGRPTIRAEVLQCDADEAELGSLFANLFQSTLSDFETYIGFKRIQEKSHLTQESIAELSGKSRSYVAKVLSFDDLPLRALELLETAPHSLGANGAFSLAAIAKKGRGQQVIKAVELIIAGELQQGAAAKYASVDQTSKAPAPTTSKRVKVGNTTYCSIRQASKVLRLEFKDDAAARAFYLAAEDILRAHLDAQ